MGMISLLFAASLTVTSGGDAFMVQGFPEGYEQDAKLTEWIGTGDARLVNFETVVNDGTCRPAAWSGGTWSSMDPSVLPDFLSYGFNGCGCANNHSLDFSQDALFMTMRKMRELNMPFAGIGEDMQEATRAAFVDTPNGKVAFLSVTAEFHPDAMAGWKTSRMPGRPGLSGLRWKETYLVTAQQLEWVKEIASATGINGNRELDIRTGFTAPDAPGTFQMGKLAFKEADKPGRTSVCNANDLKRLTDAIAEAKKSADVVVVMPHSHTMRYKNVEEPAPYFTEFCRAAVDAGADAVIGGGTHQLKGIELRNGKPIFYSLGDFVFQNNVVPIAPPDFCEQYGVPIDSDAKTAFNARSKGGKVGLHAFRENFLSVVPRLRFDDGKLAKIEMLPIELHWMQDWSVNGLPRAADAEATAVIFETLKRTSAEFGTRLELRGDGIIEIPVAL
jgi:poly-gamma-glutamate synthesis protein (capsule biosynthesis protein)